MNRNNIDQALMGLIPTLSGPLPPDLVELALSLLTRSQSVASSLKSEEEIARPYACAQLACERLKKRLNLPTIASRPPCHPRIYKKLYNYLNSALPDASTAREPMTPRKTAVSASASARNTPKTQRSARAGAQGSKEAPDWVMPAIRALTKAFNCANTAPHIYTGVETVLPLVPRMSVAAAETPTKRSRRTTAPSQASSTDASDVQILSVLVVAFLLVFSRFNNNAVTPTMYEEWQAKAIKTLLELPIGKDRTYAEVDSEVGEMIFTAQEMSWVKMEWFQNIKPREFADEMEGVEAGDGAAQSRNGKSNGLLSGGSDYIGLGTMMQDATDYLGERQQEDYRRWKAKVMARVQEVEAT